MTFAGFLLAMAVGLLTAASGQTADDEEEKATKEALDQLTKLLDNMNKGGPINNDAAAIQKKFPDNLKAVMSAAFKPRDKGGIGVGPKGMKGKGIELEIISLGKKARAAADLAKQTNDLILIGNVSKALAEIADLYPQTKKMADWKNYNNEMRKGADELIAAVKRLDAKQVKEAANNLNASCNGCHADFRD
jgi:cytochrome c556